MLSTVKQESNKIIPQMSNALETKNITSLRITEEIM